MIYKLKRRIQELFAEEPPRGFDVKQLHRELREELEAYITLKEAELEDARNCMTEFEYVETMVDSFQGGPSDNSGSEE